jgi:hypothetical protein
MIPTTCIAGSAGGGGLATGGRSGGGGRDPSGLKGGLRVRESSSSGEVSDWAAADVGTSPAATARAQVTTTLRTGIPASLELMWIPPNDVSTIRNQGGAVLAADQEQSKTSARRLDFS